MITLAPLARTRKYSRVEASPVTRSIATPSQGEFRYPAASLTTFGDKPGSIVEAIPSEWNDEVVANYLAALNFTNGLSSDDYGTLDKRALWYVHALCND